MIGPMYGPISILKFLLYIFCFSILTTGTSGEPLTGFPVSRPVKRQLSLPVQSNRVNYPTALLSALDVQQSSYFEINSGKWPSGIDWTTAVTGTSIAQILSTFSTSFYKVTTPTSTENLINRYFSQLTAAYLGQAVSDLKNQANDDMLWAVLEWLEGIKFIDEHSLHYKPDSLSGYWYGQQWEIPFAQRARDFWDLASQGWNTTLCEGGMIWNPRLLPYKNAITNELYISASIAMYLYLPDNVKNSSSQIPLTSSPPLKSRDPKYLAAAVEAYAWLMNSNMTNRNGLFVDGYHISGWNSSLSNNTKCDERDEMLYTYNQGVILSGQYGLYQVTGARSYLEDGHRLIANTIAATGWDLESGKPLDSPSGNETSTEPGKWHGLGQFGILEEICDASASCSQDAQTFKGIYFSHLTSFCAHLTNPLTAPEDSAKESSEETQQWHEKNCQRYGRWIRHNALAALGTLDYQGKFGGWWNAPANITVMPFAEIYERRLPPGAIDYRNLGVPQSWKFGINKRLQARLQARQRKITYEREKINPPSKIMDLNDRGRGRTLETQFGGLSVLRALWEIVESREEAASNI